MQKLLKQIFEKNNICANEDMLNKLEMFYNIVVEENKKFNLTAITEKYDFATKHILDCAFPAKLLPQNAKIIDIGAGAGFPSVVLKILRPDLDVVMLDSLNKRVNFLNETCKILSLNNIVAVHARAEDYVKCCREIFDVAIARAVANLSTLTEYCLPYVKIGGKFIAMKGSNFKEEVFAAQNAIKLLGGEIKSCETILTNEIEGGRVNIEILKKRTCPMTYPRGKNLPRINPIN